MAKIDGFRSELKKYVDKYRSWKRRVFLAKSSYYKHLIGYRIKSISFKTRREKIREFDDLNKANPEIYFTTDLVKTGFTDQLIGFSFLYKLGLGLGLKYHHTRLSSHRSTVPFLFYPYSKDKLPGENQPDVFDFLGLNPFLKASFGNNLPPDTKKVKINMEATLLRSNSVNNYETLIEEMKVILHPYLKKDRKILITFECYPKTYFKHYRYVGSRVENELDFRRIFKDQVRNVSSKSNFKDKNTKVMVHIRQGDTGAIRTPWNTIIPTWHETKGRYTQFKNRKDISHQKLIDVDDFYGFVKNLSEQLNKAETSTVIFSDGFKKTFRAIYQSYKTKNISHEEIAKLKEIEPVYDEKEFEKFRMLPAVETVIGEEVKKLFDFIHSFMEADVLIFGTQGLMIPKFLATYGDPANMPLMVMLYKAERPYLNHIGIDNLADHVLFVDIENYDMSGIAKQLDSYLNKRNSIANSHNQ